MAGFDGEIKINTVINTKSATSQMLSLENQISKTANKISVLKEKMSHLSDGKAPTDEYARLQGELDKADKKFTELLMKQDKMVALGQNSGKAWETLDYDMEEAGAKFRAIEEEMNQLVADGKAFKLGSDTDEYSKYSRELQDEKSKMDVLIQRHNELEAKQKQVGKTGEKSMKRIGNATKKTGGLLGTLKGRLKGIMLSLLVFNWISKGFNAMVSAMKEGFQNLSKYSKEYNGTMSEFKGQLATLKNNLAAAFQPIAVMIIPYLSTFVGWLNKACESISRFFAIMTGKSSYTIAKKQIIDYKSTLDDASKSAQNATASFDDLNVLNSDKGSSGNSSSGGGFEEVQLKGDELKPDAESLGKSAGEAINNFVSKLKEKIDGFDALEFGKSIGTFFGTAITEVNWLELGSLAAELFKKALEICFGTGWGIGDAIAKDSFGDDYTEFGFEEGLDTIKESFTNGEWKEAVKLWGLDISEAITGVTTDVNNKILGTDIDVGPIFDKIRQGDWKGAVEELKKYMLSTFSAITDKFTPFKKNIEDGWKKIVSGIKSAISNIKAAFTSVTTFIKKIANSIIGFIEKMVNGVISGLNFLVSALNLIHFDVPDWVTDLTGMDSFGFELEPIESVTLPRLARGGITTGSTLANIGEAGKEAVLPLENNTDWMYDLAEVVNSSKGSGRPIYMQIDGTTFARVINPYINKETSRVGLRFSTT